MPAFRSLGILGFHLALLTAMLAAIRAGVPLLDALAISATAGLSFFAWALLRRRLTGRESLVLLEHVWVAFGAVTAFLVAAGGPVLPGLDVLAVAICVFLAFGRVGCLVAGCCHGQPSPFGIVYPPELAPHDRLRGVRLFPLPAVEAVALLVIGAVGFVLAGGEPGTATVWVLAAYATVRFGTEALRGDARPTLAGLSTARVMAVGQLIAAVLVAEAWLGSDDSGRRRLAAVVPLAVVLVAGVLLARRRRDDYLEPSHLDEMWDVMRTLARGADRSPDPAAVTQPPPTDPPPTATTSRGVRLAASWTGSDLHVSVSAPAAANGVAGHLPYALGLVPLTRTPSATHLVVPAARIGISPPEIRFEGGPIVAGRSYDPGPRRRRPEAADTTNEDSYFGARPD